MTEFSLSLSLSLSNLSFIRVMYEWGRCASRGVREDGTLKFLVVSIPLIPGREFLFLRIMKENDVRSIKLYLSAA
jgi:hypothetical protein